MNYKLKEIFSVAQRRLLPDKIENNELSLK